MNEVNEDQEPFFPQGDEKRILSELQNLDVYPDPDIARAVGEKGDFTNEKVTIDDKELSIRYWQRNHKRTALVLLISSGFLFLMLVNESHFLDSAYDFVSNQVIGLISYVVGIFWK